MTDIHTLELPAGVSAYWPEAKKEKGHPIPGVCLLGASSYTQPHRLPREP